METADNPAMHVTETKTLCSSLNCPKTTNEEITKEREEELLYGSNEDGEAESEDSFRLTYSDEGEEQQTTNRGITAEVIKPPCTEKELGSSLPSSEMTERPNIMKEEMMTNGQVSHEHDSRQVEGTNNKAESDEFRNGDGDVNVDASLAPPAAVDSPNKQWHYSGHFGDRSKQTRQDSFPRQHRPPNPCSEKYYNQNAHYGRDKNCLRALKFHSRTETRESIDSGPRDSLSAHENLLSANERTNDCKISSKSIDDRSSIDSPDTNISCEEESTGKVSENNETQENVVNDVSEPPDVLSEAKNVEKTPDCTDDAESTREDKPNEIESSTNGKPDRIVGQKSSEVDAEAKDKNHRVACVLESTNVDEDSSDPKATVSIENSLNPTGKKEESIADSIDQKLGESAPEIETESVDDGEDTPENTRETENGKNFMSETEKKLENGKNNRSVESENDLKDTGHQAEEKTCKNQDEVVSKNNIVCDNEKIVSSPKVDEPINDEKEISTVGTSGENFQKNSVAILPQESNGKSDAQKRNDSNSSRKNEAADNGDAGENKKRGEDIEENVESAKIVDSSNKTREKDAAIPQEKLDDSKSSEPTRDSSTVAIGGSKTNEGKTNVSSDQKVTSDIALTDSEEKIISSSNNADGQPVNNNVSNKVETLRSSLKRTLSELLLDEMDLSKRIQIGRKKNENPSESSVKENDSSHVLSGSVTDEIEKRDKNIDTSNVENTVTNCNGDNEISESEGSSIIDNVVEKSCGPRRNTEEKHVVRSDDHEADDDERVDDCEVIEVPAKRKQKRSRKSLNTLRENSISQDESQDTENVRQRRKTAKNAEEIIRKGCLANTDSESNDSLSKFVTVSHKTNNHSRATSPPTLKRNYVDGEVKSEGTTKKKLKSDVTLNGDTSTKSEPVESDIKQTLHNVRQFFRRDANGSLSKLRQEELEELLIQKIVETITMRDEIGRLREQAKVSERNQEATRVKCQQLAKQIKDFDMVLGRYKSDLRSNPDAKTVVPIKINRSVGLQVNFVTDHGIQNLRQLQQAQKLITGGTVNGAIAAHPQQQIQQPKQPAQQLAHPPTESPTIITGLKRTVKVRSPRRPENPITTPVNTAASTPVNSPHASTVTPTALVVSKPVLDARPSVTSANQPTSAPHPQLLTSNQTILVNGNLTNQAIRQSTPLQASKTKNSDLIDLTQEEEKTKAPAGKITTATNSETSPNVSNVQKIAPRFHTVIQTIPGNMAITAQTGIRVVQPSSQPTPTALVNNMNAPRLAYVTMQSGMVPRQVVLTSTATPIRPAPTNNIRTSFPIAGTINNNAVRVIPTTAAPPLIYKHPASLPESSNPMSSPSWKLPPPAPSLKISKVTNGIVLSWNMALSEKYADIASYQLYAYQEISGIAPSSSLWKKVGDVRALPLPMACTLTQFSEGNNYYFAVRAVDKHSRLGQYSQPGNISL